MSIRQGGKVIAGNVSHYNIGDTFMTKRTDTSLAGAVECDGATYNTTDFTGTGSIGELLESGKLDYVSLSAYSTAISTEGWCDKIGWDGAGNTSFRVPTLNAHIVQTNNIPVVGNGTALGLTNGTQTAGLCVAGIANTGAAVPYQDSYGTAVGTQKSGAGMFLDKSIGITTDPTKSGIIADTSDTAQLRVMIQIANSATDEALETCTGVLADVAGLKDMSNITADGKEVCANMAMPSNRYINLTLGSSGSTYTAPADGYFMLKGQTTTATNLAYGLFNISAASVGMLLRVNANGVDFRAFTIASKGQTVRVIYEAALNNVEFKFIYANGAQ